MDQTAARSPNRRPVVFRDGLGRRCRVPDQAGNEKLEILCLRPELTVSDQFEAALRERVARLATFRSPEFSRLKSVERLRDQSSTLVLVSETTPGQRLSDLIATAERRVFGLDGTAAWCIVKQLVAAIATLHEEAADVAHGAISAERIVITPDARVVVVEYALASALKHVRLSHEQFWKELRVACPRAAAAAPLDHRADITQVGVVALSLVLGRALRDEEYPTQLSKLVESAATTSANGTPLPDPLRQWLLRALQLKGRESFASAIEASALLDEALEESARTLRIEDLEAFLSRCRQEQGSGSRLAAAAADTPAVEAAALAPEPSEPSESASSPASANVPEPPAPTPAAAEPAPAPAASEAAGKKPGPRLVSATSRASNPALQFPAEAPAGESAGKTGGDAAVDAKPPAAAASELFASTTERSDNKIWRRTAAAAALLTVISGAGWAAASYFDASAEPSATPPLASSATTPPAQFASAASLSVSPAIGPDSARTDVVEPAPTELTAGVAATTTEAVGPVAPPTGWITVNAPSDLQVFENGALIGSTGGGRLALAPGAHQIELVSEAIGYRSTRSVQVRSNETAALKVEFPNGTIALNATPWAEVFIDGRSVGETPIGNLSISAGSHEVVFRHPELGEQRTVATVTLSAPTRLSVDMRKR